MPGDRTDIGMSCSFYGLSIGSVSIFNYSALVTLESRIVGSVYSAVIFKLSFIPGSC